MSDARASVASLPAVAFPTAKLGNGHEPGYTLCLYSERVGNCDSALTPTTAACGTARSPFLPPPGASSGAKALVFAAYPF